MKNSLYIVWNETNNLGIPIIDEQHRGIVSTINTLYNFVELGKGLEALSPTLNIIDQYAILHFETEEFMLTQAGYPDCSQHFHLHEALVEKTKQVRFQATLDKDPKIALKFLREWWLNHINVEDRKFVNWLR